jgi:hypothetical protein
MVGASWRDTLAETFATRRLMSRYELEALAKLALLREQGSTPEAFTFRQAFGPPDAMQPRAPFALGDACPAT